MVDYSILSGALYNCCDSEAKTPKKISYGKGIIVGIVTALVASGIQFREALTIVKRQFVEINDINPDCIPECWIEHWREIPAK